VANGLENEGVAGQDVPAATLALAPANPTTSGQSMGDLARADVTRV